MTDQDPFAHDKLDRRPDAELLTQILVGEPRPAVISVDAPWGHGKTTFVQMWANLLKSRGHPVVFYNAWEIDYVDDPLVAFIGELEEDLIQLQDAPSQQQWRRLKALALGVIRSAGPLAVRLATQGVVDLSNVPADTGFVGDATAQIGDYAARVTKETLEAYAREKKAVTSFRETLADLARKMTAGHEAVPPIVIFVDELDRCRPSYAVALLERMKHLFAVEGVVFVLALDRDQLAHTVRALYGEGFEAEGYLRRFIDFDYHLPAPRDAAFVEYLAAKHRVEDVYKANKASRDEASIIVPDFAELSRIFSLSLRDQEQAFQRIVLALKSAAAPNQYLYTRLMVFFGVLRMGDPSVYQEYMAGNVGVGKLFETVRALPGGAIYLDSHRGVVTQAYVIASARRGSDASEIINEARRRAEDEKAGQEERGRAGRLLDQVGRVQSYGGALHALRVALGRLERINQQVEVQSYD